jgi:hypothetical protein
LRQATGTVRPEELNVERVTIPTTRSNLARWLNTHLNRDNA